MIEITMKKNNITLKELVKNNIVTFSHYRQGYFHYDLIVQSSEAELDVYQFPVPIDDIGTATLMANDKAITYMRWIRKAMEDNTLFKLKKHGYDGI